jgi:hypothetical protein
MLPDAEILSISSTGMMAISLERRWAGRFLWTGTLAQVSILGGAPREIEDDVQGADWGPDGELAIVRTVSGKHRLEYPINTVLYETAGWISHARVSPDGERVAFIDHPVPGDDGGSVVVVERSGRTSVLSTGWITAYGLAWPKHGREVWFTATRAGVARAIWAVALSGGERLLLRALSELTIQDVSSDGRILITSDNGKVGIIGQPPGQSHEKDLSLLDWSRMRDLSPDGKTLFSTKRARAAAPTARSISARPTAPPPCASVTGSPTDPPDGKWEVGHAHTLPPDRPPPGSHRQAAGNRLREITRTRRSGRRREPDSRDRKRAGTRRPSVLQDLDGGPPRRSPRKGWAKGSGRSRPDGSGSSRRESTMRSISIRWTGRAEGYPGNVLRRTPVAVLRSGKTSTCSGGEPSLRRSFS